MNEAMPLAQWAQRMGISYKTAWRLVRAKKLPPHYQAIQFPTGTIRILEHRLKNQVDGPRAAIYARINSRLSVADMDNQVMHCRMFCRGRGWEVERVVREKAPGFGPGRKKLHSLLVNLPRYLVVARPSVLSRFDLPVFEILLKNLGCKLIIVDRDREKEGGGGALEDLTDAISSTCHLHYGPKRGRALVEDLTRLVKRGSKERRSVGHTR